MRKLPEITLNDWMDAEQRAGILSTPTQPTGSVTVQQYANARGIVWTTAARRLEKLVLEGLASKRLWETSRSGTNPTIYFLNKKAKKQ